MSDYTIQCSTCGAPDMMLCDCSLPEAPAPLDEARIREILAEEITRSGIGKEWARQACVYGVVNGSSADRWMIEGALAAMSSAISEATAKVRAETIEACARIADRESDRHNTESGFDSQPSYSTACRIAAAIRSQDNPDKQGE